jgi:uncharacterized protein with FMN-binding domain
MRKNKKKVFIILFIVFIFIIGIYLWLTICANKGLKSLVYENISMDLVTDGTYDAEVDVNLVFVKVQVTVKNHKITNIDIMEHRNGLGKKAEAIVNHMITENTYAVDAVSGATLSSECIKSTVSKALKSGYQK